MKDTETPAAWWPRYADILQIGARNMQNFSLLEAVGELRKPVLLKRGLSATLKELLMAAEYIVARGNRQVDPLRARHPHLRDDDPQHARHQRHPDAEAALAPARCSPIRRTASACGTASPAMARAAVAAGADGLIVEVHPDPARALSDGHQSLTFAEFEELMTGVRAVASAIGRSVAGPVA